MILIKIILLQAFWFWVILYGHGVNLFIQLSLALLFIIFDFLIYRPHVSFAKYIVTAIIFTLFGLCNDSFLISSGLIKEESYQYGNLSLWLIFVAYYDALFSKFLGLRLSIVSLIGGLGGSLSYWSAYKLGAIEVSNIMPFVFSQFIFWALFFPLSLKIYNKKRLLDYLVYLTFDKTGYKRHEKEFDEDFSNVNLKEKKVLITGGTGGIGQSVTMFMLNHQAKTVIIGRNKNKGKNLEDRGGEFVSLDMSDWESIKKFSHETVSFDYIVLNAGGMPETLVENKYGVEFQCASQLLGHYFLIHWLKEFGKINNETRIVWVSSGGMYLKKLNLDTLFKNHHYEKVDAYANVKRAQVTLVEELAKKWKDIKMYVMHPGWVDTEGLQEALPKFYRLTQKRLRTPEQGADTIIWLLLSDKKLSSGSLYFDREQVSAYISKSYIPNEEERKQLMMSISKFYQSSSRS